MLGRLIERRLRAEEAHLGASLDYLRHLLRLSRSAFFKFSLITPVSRHRRALPPGPYHVARIVAVQDADCGTCLQIEVNLAREADVPGSLLRALIEGRIGDLPPDLQDVAAFASSVAQADGEEDEWRPALLERYGEEGVAELALAIAMARVFPTLKRGLGYAKSCSLVQVEVDVQ
ncbi:hypothetical protein BH23BAC4_BH23BAC4_10780 [soil metagenome]